MDALLLAVPAPGDPSASDAADESALAAMAAAVNQTFLHHLLGAPSASSGGSFAAAAAAAAAAGNYSSDWAGGDGDGDGLRPSRAPAAPTSSTAGATSFADDYPEGAEEMLRATQFWVQRVLIPCVVMFGVFGNAATIVVLTRRRMQNSTTNIYLTALAVSDLSYLVCVFVLSIAHYPNMKQEPHYSYWKLYIYTLLITDSSSNTSVWLTVCFTLERYVAVCHPILGKIICTESRARRIIFGIFLVSFLSALPTPFEWRVDLRQGANNETVVTLAYSDFGRNETFRSVFYWYLALGFALVPLVTLGIFNSLLVYSLRSTRAHRDTLVNHYRGNSYHRSLRHAQEKRITIMLISVVILFLVCQTPTAVTLIYGHFCEPVTFTWAWYRLRILGNIFNLLMAFNCASNFVLYCALSLKYRRTFQHVFLPWMSKLRIWSGRGGGRSRSGSPCVFLQRIHGSGPSGNGAAGGAMGDDDFSSYSAAAVRIRGVLGGVTHSLSGGGGGGGGSGVFGRSDAASEPIPLQERTAVTSVSTGDGAASRAGTNRGFLQKDPRNCLNGSPRAPSAMITRAIVPAACACAGVAVISRHPKSNGHRTRKRTKMAAAAANNNNNNGSDESGASRSQQPRHPPSNLENGSNNGAATAVNGAADNNGVRPQSRAATNNRTGPVVVLSGCGCKDVSFSSRDSQSSSGDSYRRATRNNTCLCLIEADVCGLTVTESAS